MTKAWLDDNGQPLNRQYNCKRINDRTIDEMLGLIKGITADGTVNILEAKFLSGWMERNAQYTNDRVIQTIFKRLEEMLIDGILDQEEQQELMELLKSVSGESCPEDQTMALSTTFPLNNPPPVVDFPNATFCLTGTFAYGPRKECALAIAERGGLVKNTVTQETDYLVIGSLCSSDWIHTSYGRKIEKAMMFQDEKPLRRVGKPKIVIIHEDHWASYAFP